MDVDEPTPARKTSAPANNEVRVSFFLTLGAQGGAGARTEARCDPSQVRGTPPDGRLNGSRIPRQVAWTAHRAPPNPAGSTYARLRRDSQRMSARENPTPAPRCSRSIAWSVA